MNDKAETDELETEGSMEDILHSIRDIIADEDDSEEGNSENTDAETAEEPKAAAEEDVLELTDVVEDSDDSGDVLADIDAALEIDPEAVEKPAEEAAPEEEPVAEEEVAEETAAEEPVEEEATPETEDMPVEAVDDTVTEEIEALEEHVEESLNVESEPAEEPSESLISDNTVNEAKQSLKQLVDSIPRPEIDSPLFRDGFTIEDLVVETLKPMLSEWLDTNLPVIVEDLVQKEIRKLIPND